MRIAETHKCAECGRDRYRPELVPFGCLHFVCRTCLDDRLDPDLPGLAFVVCQVCERSAARRSDG